MLERLAKVLGNTPTLDQGFKVPKQMRPTQLAPAHRIPVVRTPAIRYQNTGKGLAQELPRYLRAA